MCNNARKIRSNDMIFHALFSSSSSCLYFALFPVFLDFSLLSFCLSFFLSLFCTGFHFLELFFFPFFHAEFFLPWFFLIFPFFLPSLFFAFFAFNDSRFYFFFVNFTLSSLRFSFVLFFAFFFALSLPPFSCLLIAMLFLQNGVKRAKAHKRKREKFCIQAKRLRETGRNEAEGMDMGGGRRRKEEWEGKGEEEDIKGEDAEETWEEEEEEEEEDEEEGEKKKKSWVWKYRDVRWWGGERRKTFPDSREPRTKLRETLKPKHS